MRGTKRQADFAPAPAPASPSPVEWRETVLPSGARFLTDPRVDDLGRGESDPPSRGTRGSRVAGALRHRISPPAVVAGAIPVAWLAAVVYSWLPAIEVWLDASMFPYLISTLAAFVTGLLAAAVLIWRRDAWRSAPLVLLGAIVGTLLPSAVDVAIQLGFHFLRDGGTSWPTWVNYAQLVVALVSVAGPLLMAIGLDRCRTANAGTRWRPSVVAGALIVAALMGGRSLAVFLGNAGGEFDPVFFWLLAAQSALHPLSIAFVLAITWCSLAALRDDELPGRFWRLTFLGSGAMAFSSIATWILSDPITRPFVESKTYLVGSTLSMLVGLAGAVVLLLAFLVPLFEAEPVSVQPAPEPNESAAFGPA